MNDSSLFARMQERYGAEQLEKMTLDEFGVAIKSTIRAAQASNDFQSAKRLGVRHVAALEFPKLSPAQLEDIVDARMRKQ